MAASVAVLVSAPVWVVDILARASVPAQTVGAAGAGVNGNFGGNSSSRISNEGLSNTNGPNSSDPDTGLDRAEDRANQEGLDHGKALDGSQDQDEDAGTDLSVNGHASGKSHAR